MEGGYGMTLGGAANEAIKGLSGSPALLLIAVMNMAMIFGLIYVAKAQQEERKDLMAGLIENCRHAP